jgi:hypothetical protein
MIKWTLLFLLLVRMTTDVLADGKKLRKPSPADLRKQVNSTSVALLKTQKNLAALSARFDSVQTRLHDSLSRINTTLSWLNREQDSLRKLFLSPSPEKGTAFTLIQDRRIVVSPRRDIFISLGAIMIMLVILMLIQTGALPAPLTSGFRRNFRAQKAGPSPPITLAPEAEEHAVLKPAIEAAGHQIKKIPDPEPIPDSIHNDDPVAAQNIQAMDHELPIRMAEEIFRMRLRLSRMPAETKGIASLINAVQRLEDELNMKGYSIVDLSGQPYEDGMTMGVREFVPCDDFPASTKKILHMARPQIKFNNLIVSQGEADVGMSTEDLTKP